MRDVKTNICHSFDHGGGWSSPRHHASYLLGDTSTHRFRRVVNQAVDDRRSAVMVHGMLAHRIQNRLRFHLAQTYMGTRKHGNRPRKAPTVAMEHRQCPQIRREMRHGPRCHITYRIEVGTTVMGHYTFRVTRSAAGVAHCNSVPFILWTFQT